VCVVAAAAAAAAVDVLVLMGFVIFSACFSACVSLLLRNGVFHLIFLFPTPPPPPGFIVLADLF
jgi:hypothetical protein